MRHSVGLHVTREPASVHSAEHCCSQSVTVPDSDWYCHIGPHNMASNMTAWLNSLVDWQTAEHFISKVFKPASAGPPLRLSTKLAPQYLSDQLQYVADLPTRRRGRLRSSTSNLPDVRPSRCVTVGDRSFATAGRRLWNSLPADVWSASSLTTFHRKLKTHLFRQSYQTLCYNYVAIMVLEVTLT